MRLLVFGDSIAYGAWDGEGGWADRLKREAHTRTVASSGRNKMQVINLGVGGDTSRKIVKRLSAEIEARHSASWPFGFVFSFGTNDPRSRDGQVEVPIDEFAANVEKIIVIAKQHTSKIIFIGVPPLGRPVFMFKDQEYSDERIRSYDNRLQDIVQKAGLPFIATRPEFEAHKDEGLFAYDSLHPNDKGHQLIFDIVRPKLEEWYES